jgi:hypothetical protein
MQDTPFLAPQGWRATKRSALKKYLSSAAGKMLTSQIRTP